MGFFDSLPKPEPPPRPRYRAHPPWISPGNNIMPATLAVDGVLVRTPTLGVYVDGFRVFPYGFAFGVTVLINVAAGEEPTRDPFAMHPDSHQHGISPADRANALRIGVQYPDGSGAMVGGPGRTGDWSQPPEPPVISIGGASGGGGSWEQGLWVWNVPESGDVSLVYSWLARSVPESRLTLDGEALRAAAARAVVLWPEPTDEEDGDVAK